MGCFVILVEGSNDLNVVAIREVQRFVRDRCGYPGDHSAVVEPGGKDRVDRSVQRLVASMVGYQRGSVKIVAVRDSDRENPDAIFSQYRDNKGASMRIRGL